MMLWNLRTRCQASMESLFRAEASAVLASILRCNSLQSSAGNFKVRYDNRFLNDFGGNRSALHSPPCKTKVNEESGV